MPTNLRLKDLEVHYGKAKAIYGVEVEVEEGSITGIIGANGAGKSTLMRVISGLLSPTSGEIWFEDRRIDNKPPHEIVAMGVVQVPEGRRLFPHMNVLENLKIGAFLQDNPAQLNRSLENIFQRFPVLKDRRRQKAGTLSGGEQQMLAVGRALMAGPKLLLMDEPSWGLAPLVIAHLAGIVTEINREGVSILLVEQNAGLAFGLTDYIYVLEVGRVVLEGRIEDLKENETVQRAFLG